MVVVSKRKSARVYQKRKQGSADLSDLLVPALLDPKHKPPRPSPLARGESHDDLSKIFKPIAKAPLTRSPRYKATSPSAPELEHSCSLKNDVVAPKRRAHSATSEEIIADVPPGLKLPSRPSTSAPRLRRATSNLDKSTRPPTRSSRRTQTRSSSRAANAPPSRRLVQTREILDWAASSITVGEGSYTELPTARVKGASGGLEASSVAGGIRLMSSQYRHHAGLK